MSLGVIYFYNFGDIAHVTIVTSLILAPAVQNDTSTYKSFPLVSVGSV